jgi:hypothetical protein
MSADADLRALFADLLATAETAWAAVEQAEDEIDLAIARYPEQADLLYHAFVLLYPRELGRALNTEFVYRSHVRELLERVAAGTDTRPATAAELCVILAGLSHRAPLHAAATGLYFRIWLQAFPQHSFSAELAAQQGHYEHLHARQIDALEQDLRRPAADPRRRHGQIDCPGRHHGLPVACRFAGPSQPGSERDVQPS